MGLEAELGLGPWSSAVESQPFSGLCASRSSRRCGLQGRAWLHCGMLLIVVIVQPLRPRLLFAGWDSTA